MPVKTAVKAAEEFNQQFLAGPQCFSDEYNGITSENCQLRRING